MALQEPSKNVVPSSNGFCLYLYCHFEYLMYALCLLRKWFGSKEWKPISFIRLVVVSLGPWWINKLNTNYCEYGDYAMSLTFSVSEFSQLFGWQQYKAKTIKSMCLKMTLLSDSFDFLFCLFQSVCRPDLIQFIGYPAYFHILDSIRFDFIDNSQ